MESSASFFGIIMWNEDAAGQSLTRFKYRVEAPSATRSRIILLIDKLLYLLWRTLKSFGFEPARILPSQTITGNEQKNRSPFKALCWP
jgi:hypothetical protein